MREDALREKKYAKQDLLILTVITMLPLFIYVFFGSAIMQFGRNSENNIWLRFLPVLLIQFGQAGLGASVVAILRKESLKSYGMRRANSIKAIIFACAAFLPHMLFVLFVEGKQRYTPFMGMFLTKEILGVKFPFNLLGYSVIVLVWGFFEGFTYLVWSRKINQLMPSSNKWINWGAIFSATVCVLIHGMVGLDAETILEGATSFIFVYCILTSKDILKNSWGCIFSFMFLWNAFY